MPNSFSSCRDKKDPWPSQPGRPRVLCCSSGLFCEVAGIQAVVGTLLFDQLVMGAPLDDAALVHNHNAVRVADGRQTVGNDKGSTSTHQSVHAVLHQLLGAGIDGRGGLIQDEHRRVGHSGPGNGNELPLALGQVGSVSGEHGVVSVRQAADKAVCVGQLGRRLTLLVGGLQVAVADVFQHCAGKQVGILKDDAQGAAQVRLFDLIDIDAVIADLAVGNVVETIYEVGNGGLACAGGTDKGDLLPRFGPQADVVENQLVFVCLLYTSDAADE